MSSHGLGLASSAGLSWDVCGCSLGRELASLPRVQPVSGLSGADRVNWPPSKGSPGPLSLLTVFYLLAPHRAAAFQKGERRLRRLGGQGQATPFLWLSTGPNALPTSPRFGRSGETLRGHI